MTNPNESSSSSKTNKKTTKEPEQSTPPPPIPPYPQGQNPSATATPAAPANPPQRTSVPAPPAPWAAKRGEAGGSSFAARKPSAAAANVPMAAVAVGGGGSSTGAVGLPPQQAPQRLKASEIEGPQTCFVCNKSFASRKALYGHMRSHPERNWRGVNPPPNFGSHAAGPRPRLADQPSRPSGQLSYGAGSSGGQPVVGLNIDLNQPQVEIFFLPARNRRKTVGSISTSLQ